MPKKSKSALQTRYLLKYNDSEQIKEEDIAAAVKLINQVSLPGKPYELTFIGAGPEYLTFSLTDGTVLKFGVMSSSDYFYWIDEEQQNYLIICKPRRCR